jgi:hypothetical protein
VEVVARPARQPGLNLGMLVGTVVVRDQMEVDPGRDAAVKVVKKREKCLMAMARLTQGKHFALQGVEGREQGGSLPGPTNGRSDAPSPPPGSPTSADCSLCLRNIYSLMARISPSVRHQFAPNSHALGLALVAAEQQRSGNVTMTMN